MQQLGWRRRQVDKREDGRNAAQVTLPSGAGPWRAHRARTPGHREDEVSDALPYVSTHPIPPVRHRRKAANTTPDSLTCFSLLPS